MEETNWDEPAAVRKMKRIEHEHRPDSIVFLRREPHRVPLEVVAHCRARREGGKRGLDQFYPKSKTEAKAERPTCCRPFGIGGRERKGELQLELVILYLSN